MIECCCEHRHKRACSRDDIGDETYDVMKTRFEKEHTRVDFPFSYLKVTTNEDGSTTLELFKHYKFSRLYSHLRYVDMDAKGNMVRRRFISAWFCDHTHRVVSSVVVDLKGEKAGIYNAWSGFRAARLDPSTYFLDVQDAMGFVVSPIIRHLNELIGCKERANWILDWFANIVQRPWQKTQVAIFLLGLQEYDLLTWIRQCVLGDAHTLRTANPKRDLFGRFSDAFANRVLVHIDNVKNLQSHDCVLNGAITNSTTNWELRRGPNVQAPNISNFILTASDESVFKISSDSRRFAVFRCSPVHDETLAKHLQLPGVDAWFFDFLMQRDLCKYSYSFQNSLSSSITSAPRA